MHHSTHRLAWILIVVASRAVAQVSSGATTAPPTTVAEGLRRSPYLQSVGRDSALVVWDALDAGPGAVDFGASLEYGHTVTAQAEGSRRVATLRGLEPGAQCYYRVRAGERVLAGGPEYSFLTDAGPEDREITFFVTGDIGDPKGRQASTAAAILRSAPRPEFGIICGDVVYNDGASHRYDANLMRPWSSLLRTIPVWPSLGNHDWKSDPEKNFRREWYLPHNEHYYGYDFGSAHFIALDTRDKDIFDLDAQVAWFENELRQHADAEWLFVYFHHPGLTCTYKGNTAPVVEHLLPLIDRYDVDVVFTGHAHTYERLYPIAAGRPVDVEQDPHYTDPRGTIFVTSGAGSKAKEGRRTNHCGPTAAFRDRTILWTRVEVRGNVCAIRSFTTDGDVLVDEVTITKTRFERPTP